MRKLLTKFISILLTLNLLLQPLAPTLIYAAQSTGDSLGPASEEPPPSEPEPTCTTSTFVGECGFSGDNWCRIGQSCTATSTNILVTCPSTEKIRNIGTYCTYPDGRKSFSGYSDCVPDSSCWQSTPEPIQETTDCTAGIRNYRFRKECDPAIGKMVWIEEWLQPNCDVTEKPGSVTDDFCPTTQPVAPQDILDDYAAGWSNYTTNIPAGTTQPADTPAEPAPIITYPGEPICSLSATPQPSSEGKQEVTWTIYTDPIGQKASWKGPDLGDKLVDVEEYPSGSPYWSKTYTYTQPAIYTRQAVINYSQAPACTTNSMTVTITSPSVGAAAVEPGININNESRQLADINQDVAVTTDQPPPDLPPLTAPREDELILEQPAPTGPRGEVIIGAGSQDRALQEQEGLSVQYSKRLARIQTEARESNEGSQGNPAEAISSAANNVTNVGLGVAGAVGGATGNLFNGIGQIFQSQSQRQAEEALRKAEGTIPEPIAQPIGVPDYCSAGDFNGTPETNPECYPQQRFEKAKEIGERAGFKVEGDPTNFGISITGAPDLSAYTVLNQAPVSEEENEAAKKSAEALAHFVISLLPGGAYPELVEKSKKLTAEIFVVEAVCKQAGFIDSSYVRKLLAQTPKSGQKQRQEVLELGQQVNPQFRQQTEETRALTYETLLARAKAQDPSLEGRLAEVSSLSQEEAKARCSQETAALETKIKDLNTETAVMTSLEVVGALPVAEAGAFAVKKGIKVTKPVIGKVTEPIVNAAKGAWDATLGRIFGGAGKVGHVIDEQLARQVNSNVHDYFLDNLKKSGVKLGDDLQVTSVDGYLMVSHRNGANFAASAIDPFGVSVPRILEYDFKNLNLTSIRILVKAWEQTMAEGSVTKIGINVRRGDDALWRGLGYSPEKDGASLFTKDIKPVSNTVTPPTPVRTAEQALEQPDQPVYVGRRTQGTPTQVTSGLAAPVQVFPEFTRAQSLDELFRILREAKEITVGDKIYTADQLELIIIRLQNAKDIQQINVLLEQLPNVGELRTTAHRLLIKEGGQRPAQAAQVTTEQTVEQTVPPGGNIFDQARAAVGGLFKRKPEIPLQPSYVGNVQLTPETIDDAVKLLVESFRNTPGASKESLMRWVAASYDEALSPEQLDEIATRALRMLAEKTAQAPRLLQPGAAIEQGGRTQNQDRIAIKTLSSGGFAGVFDGNGTLGHNVAEYASQNLASRYQGYLDQGLSKAEALKKAIYDIDQEVVSQWGKAGGSTAAVVHVEGRDLLIGNVGDSRVILSDKGKALQLTKDHNMANLEEVRRLGFEGSPQTGMANRITRVLGGHLGKFGPDVEQWTLGSQAEFIVIGSDGLTGVMENQAIVNFVRERLGRIDPQQISQELVNLAIQNGSDDNVTTLIIPLRHLAGGISYLKINNPRSTSVKLARAGFSLIRTAQAAEENPPFGLFGLLDQNIYQLWVKQNEIKKKLLREGKVDSTYIKTVASGDVLKSQLKKTTAGYELTTGSTGLLEGNIPSGRYAVAIAPLVGFDIKAPAVVEIKEATSTVIPVAIKKGTGKVEKTIPPTGWQWLLNKLFGTVFAQEKKESQVQLVVFSDTNNNGKIDKDEQVLPWAGLKVELKKVNQDRTLPLTAGWNLVALEVLPQKPINASTFLQEIAKQGGYATTVSTLENGAWKSFVVRGDKTYSGDDFPITPGKAYFVKALKSSVLVYQGQELVAPIKLNLASGWNGVGVPYSAKPYQAADFIDTLNTKGAGSDTASRWESGLWDTFVKQGQEAFGENFPIEQARGYLLKVEKGLEFSP